MPSSPSDRPERVAALCRVGRFAHRGRHGGAAVENSQPAFAAAIAAGEGIECDVRLSADGVPYVFHDARLDRLIGRPGQFGALDSSAIARLRLIGSGDPVPTLAALLAQVAGKVPLLIEVKRDPGHAAQPICIAVAAALAGYAGAVGVMSFDPRVARWFARHRPAILRGLVVSETGRERIWHRLAHRLALVRSRADFLAYDVRNLPSALAARARGRGLPVFAWTVRSQSDALVASLHADAMICEAAI